MELHKLIYRRAEEKGISIECGPKHRKNVDYVGSGRRQVRFSDSTKNYYYTGSLTDLGLRLELISQEEYDAAFGIVYCARGCPVSQQLLEEYENYSWWQGGCPNCGAEIQKKR